MYLGSDFSGLFSGDNYLLTTTAVVVRTMALVLRTTAPVLRTMALVMRTTAPVLRYLNES